MKSDKNYSCQDVIEKANAFLDDELGVKEVLKLKSHIKKCLPCNKKIEFEKKMISLISDKGKEKKMPKGLKNEIMKMLYKI
jgi:mycothiol system anti-sigma-R factor